MQSKVVKASNNAKKTRFKTPDYSSLIKGFDGFEAIAFNGNKVYITIEAEHNGEMVSYLFGVKLIQNH